ncbi:7939_t:CDS:1, partial [Paraglomus occultum]
MSGHYVPIKPITALPNLDSFTTRTCSTESTFYQTSLTIHERTLLLQPPYQLTCSIDELLKPARRKRSNPPRSPNPWIQKTLFTNLLK